MVRRNVRTTNDIHKHITWKEIISVNNVKHVISDEIKELLRVNKHKMVSSQEIMQ